MNETLEQLQQLVKDNKKIVDNFSMRGEGVAGHISTGYLFDPGAARNVSGMGGGGGGGGGICTRFAVSVNIVIRVTGTGNVLNEIRHSDPSTATLGGTPGCSMTETWSGLTVSNCDMGVIFDLGYSLSLSGSTWLLGGNFVANPFVACMGTDFYTFQPSDSFSDPVGIHTYTLSAFAGTVNFVMTISIAPA